VKRLLVTGAGGFLGWQACRLAAAHWQVFGLCRRPAPLPDGCEPIGCDLTHVDDVDALFSELRPDAVIHTAAAADPNFCETHPDQTEPINVHVPVWLAGRCAREKIPLLFTSSDLVFDGTRPPYSESDPVAPVNVYGAQKARAEAAVLSVWPGALICRMPLLFGWSGSVHAAFDREMILAIEQGRPLRLFTDEFRTPVDVQSAAAGLLLLLQKASGIFHLGGAERISRFELGVRIAGILGASPQSLIPALQQGVSMAAARPADVSLVNRKARRLGYDPPPLDDAIRKAVAHARATAAASEVRVPKPQRRSGH